MSSFSSDLRPLEGVPVVDLSRALAGPQATMMLADMCARGIKVEAPEGDESRRWGPPFVSEDSISPHFLSSQRNKELVTADVKIQAGRGFLECLLRRADVLVEEFQLGVLDRLGFAVERLRDLNPRLVLCSLSRFCALFEREHTEKGGVVGASLLSSVAAIHAFQGTRVTVAGEHPVAEGNHHPSIAPYGLFQCADWPVQIAWGNDNLWRRLCAVLDLGEENERFLTNAARVDARAELTTLVNSSLSSDNAEAWLASLEEAGVPAGRVRSLPEVYDWEQSRSQGLVFEVDHPTLGMVELPGPALRFDDNAYAGGRTTHLHPPLLGEHNEAVRAWLAKEASA